MKVGLAGLGGIGLIVARALDDGLEGLELAGVCSGNQAKATANMTGFRNPAPLMRAEQLAADCDIIVECVPKAAFLEIAEPVLKAGRILVTVSGAGILANPGVIGMAKEHGARIILATGALLGLDAVRAAAEGAIHEVRMVTRKPPNYRFSRSRHMVVVMSPDPSFIVDRHIL